MAARTVDEAMLRKMDGLRLSDKLSRWKEAVLSATPTISSARMMLATESWKETEGEDIQIRRAKLLKKILEGMPIVIFDWQLMAGSDTEHVLGGNPFMDFAGDYMEQGLIEENQVLVGTPVRTGVMSEQTRKELLECSRYWKGKTTADYEKKALELATGTWYDDWVEAKGQYNIERQGIFFWPPPMTQRLLTKGLRGIIKEAEAKIQRFKEEMRDAHDVERLYFWQGVVIVCEALINLARRYSKLAAEMAKGEQNAERRRELKELAKVCERVPGNPPRTFHEAIQSITLAMLAIRLEMPTAAGTAGRLDQDLWPFFDRDIREGRITLEKAGELIGGLIAYLGTQIPVSEYFYIQMVQLSAQINVITVGGVDSDGSDACNELTYLILHMAGLLRSPEPHLGFGWNEGTPHWAMLKALDTNMKLNGIPHFLNGKHVEEYWKKRGVPVEESRNWCNEGCVGCMPSAHLVRGTGYLNTALVLDLALHNGIAPVTGKRIGPETGDPRTFETFEDLWDAYEKQYQFVVKRMLWVRYLGTSEEARYARQPFYSSLIPMCVEREKDILIPEVSTHSELIERGLLDVADSLTAVKKLVYDDKRLSMNELMDALDSNFDGERGEEIRQMCLAAPKYGNDIDEADYMARKVGKFSARVMGKKRAPEGHGWGFYRNGVSWHYFGGQGVGALLNGRKALAPLYDGSLSPMAGADKRGPTAVLRSALKADWIESGQTVLNQRFALSLAQSPEGREKLAALTDTFMRGGGQHIQYNFVDGRMLRDAQEHPERYRDLIVRVGGFSTYFVFLTREVQDDIIARTEHGGI
jgi:pyruvate-formate lyase